jgi:hypothetical protein
MVIHVHWHCFGTPTTMEKRNLLTATKVETYVTHISRKKVKWHWAKGSVIAPNVGFLLAGA